MSLVGRPWPTSPVVWTEGRAGVVPFDTGTTARGLNNPRGRAAAQNPYEFLKRQIVAAPTRSPASSAPRRTATVRGCTGGYPSVKKREQTLSNDIFPWLHFYRISFC